MQITGSASLYNSRITQTYLGYLRAVHPGVQIDKILQQAGMTREEVNDPAHWFTQAQTDRFHEVLVAETGDEHIARHAGRFVASAQGLNLIKQYVLGLMNIETVFASMAKIIPLITKGAAVTVKRLGPGTIEIVSKPNSGVHEKRYQCENRTGYFEALPKLFTNCYARIEHPACFHRGDPFCRYIISWETSFSVKLRILRNYSFLVSFCLLIALGFSAPSFPLFSAAALSICINLVLSLAFAHQRLKEQERVIESHHKMAEEDMASANTNYNNALLVQEIGRATAAIFDTHELMNKLAVLMQRRLAFDRGLILLADESGRRLVYSAGYGYDEDEKKHLQGTVFKLDHPDSKGIFVKAFLDQKHIAVNNIRDFEETLSPKSRNLARNLGVRSLLCVPIVFKNKSLGILAVDNVHSMTPLKKSDVHLLQGIASHIAISINNSRSFQKLKQSEAKYRQTLECIAEGYYEIDRTNAIIFANNALCKLLDCSFNGLMGRRFDDFFSPDDRHQIGDLFKSIQEDGHTVRFAHFTMARITGDLIPVDISASLVCDANGQQTGFRGLIRDATDRLNMENEKIILKNKLLQSQKMEAIGTLAGGIAHNFNNWLCGILGNITLIRLDSPQDGKIRERIRKIEDIVESAARMTRQLLGYARAGKYKVDLIDINKVIKDSADTFRIARKDIAIRLKLDPKVAAVKADRGQIEQVLWNLYANAVDAMPDGGELIIETGQTPSEALQEFDYEIAPGDYVCFSISDSGIGIDPEHRESIFEPFSTTENGKGTGLRLASVYGIVKSHGGYVDVKSSKGRGSTFSIFLPVAEEAYIAAQQSNASATSAGREKVLLVDDEDMILDTCSRLLAKLGYAPLTALTGKEALEIYARHANSIDLVIIDMIMPDMNGRELFDRFKKINPSVKTVLSSGYSLNEQAQNILDRGCDGFIQKPYNIIQLSELIRKIMKPTIS